MSRPCAYRSLRRADPVSRREFVRAASACTAVAGGIVLGVPGCTTPLTRPKTNIDDFMRAPRGKHALPGAFPGKVVEVHDRQSLVDGQYDDKVVAEMFERGVQALTGRDMRGSFALFFEPSDVVGIKVNPVGSPLISTRVELAQIVVGWLIANGIPASNVIIWDRFDYMLRDAGFTPDRFPAGVGLEGLQTMDERGNAWRDKSGRHVSIDNFDQDVYYFVKGLAGRAPGEFRSEEQYLNQNVFNGEYSYYGKLLTQRVTKLVNLSTFKSTGHGVSIATKNLGYGAVCNTSRLHEPLFFDVNVEVLAAPVIRDKLVLNVTDAIRGQYDDGPYLNAQFVYDKHSLFFATDPFALDMLCHRQLVAKRKEMGISVNEHPRFTEYLRYAERLGLGVTTPGKVNHVKVGA